MLTYIFSFLGCLIILYIFFKWGHYVGLKKGLTHGFHMGANVASKAFHEALDEHNKQFENIKDEK